MVTLTVTRTQTQVETKLIIAMHCKLVTIILVPPTFPLNFYRTLVRSLSTLVSDSLTNSLLVSGLD